MHRHAHKHLALVTGGAGFIGSQLVDALVEAGWRVAVIDDLSHGKRRYVHPAATFLKLGIGSPKAREWIVKNKPKVVFHLAAQISVSASVKNPLADADTNVIASLGLLDAACQAGVERFIFASSGGALAREDKLPTKETDAPFPMSPYAIAKYAIERYGAFYQEAHGVPFVAMRFANVYGPRQNPEGEAGVISIFASRMLRNESVTVNGTGKQTRDFVYVGDVVAAIMSVLDRPGLTGVFNVGTGKETDIATLFRKMAKLTDYRKRALKGPPDRSAPMRSVLDASRLTSVTGWKPEMKIDDGLRETIMWFETDGAKKGLLATIRCLL